MDPTHTLIAYYRVSTKKQQQSGLGLDAQVEAVARYAGAYQGTVLRAYREVETSTQFRLDNRPELQKAIAHAKRSRATLVIAKLDRLARNVAFVSTLMETRVDFVACDNPHANTLTVHILAAVAENEAQVISQRTRAALKVFVEQRVVPKKIRERYPEGVPADLAEATAGKLGAARHGRLPSCADRLRGSARAAAVRAGQAREAYVDLAPFVAGLRAEGLSLRAIAARLDAEGHTTRNGKSWNPVQVTRVLNLRGDAA